MAATLEALIQDPKILDATASTRIALYKLFTKIWNSIALNGKPDGVTVEPVERHIAQIPPLPRQAFLLVALEGLSEDDAAKVLDIDVPKLRELVEESGRELAAEIATDVLIIEDETFIALDLEGLVEGLGHRVLGVARASFSGQTLPDSHRDFAFEFLGLVGLADPLRASVPAAVSECRTAGIRVVMITGDYPATAKAIARQAGIDATDVVSGEELQKLSEAELAQRVRGATVFARIMPEQKNPVNRALIWLYRPVIDWVLRHRKLTIAVAFIALAASAYPVTRIGS